jgi:hypothetical protein
MRIKIALVFIVGLFGTLAWSTAAGADSVSYGPTVTTEITTTSAIVDPCGTTTVSGTGFQPGETVTITLQGAVIGTATADATGAFSTSVTIPTGTSAGTYTIVSTGSAGDSSSTQLTVGSGTCGTPTPTFTTVSSSTPTSGLAFTGADIARLVEIAGIALGVGGLLLLATRRRRQATN